MSAKVNAALIFACTAHAVVGQERKYTGEPYITHPIEVMMLVREHGGDEDMQCAALLHDVLEDTEATSLEVFRGFGSNVLSMVEALTDTETGNRAARKAASCSRLGAASSGVQTIKLADLVSNSRTIIARDPDFAKVYLREKVALLRVLTCGDGRLWNLAAKQIPDEYWADAA